MGSLFFFSFFSVTDHKLGNEYTFLVDSTPVIDVALNSSEDIRKPNFRAAASREPGEWRGEPTASFG
jgi:hypothetical protein